MPVWLISVNTCDNARGAGLQSGLQVTNNRKAEAALKADTNDIDTMISWCSGIVGALDLTDTTLHLTS